MKITIRKNTNGAKKNITTFKAYSFKASTNKESEAYYHIAIKDGEKNPAKHHV